MATVSPNLFREAVEAATGQVIVDRPAFVCLVESVEDSEEHCSQGDHGDFNHSLWESRSFEVGENFVARAELAELLTLIEQLNAVEFATPFVVERAVLVATVCHPEARTVERDSVR